MSLDNFSLILSFLTFKMQQTLCLPTVGVLQKLTEIKHVKYLEQSKHSIKGNFLKIVLFYSICPRDDTYFQTVH